jgi:iron complex outermembrane receptor protein
MAMTTRSRSSRRTSLRLHALAWASALCASPTLAQTSTATDVVQVTGRALQLPASVSGFGDAPPARSPFQATSLSAATLADAGTDTLNELTRQDASIGDAYNSPGYWASMRVRGYQLDNRFNYRRDGLPINGETALPLANKDRVEVFKGLSGIQAGTSAPGGLVNLVVKRSRADSTLLRLGLSDGGNVLLAADVDRRFGTDGESGLRVNLSAEHLDPLLRSSQGHRALLAVAGDTRLGAQDKLEAEVELSRQSQPSAPGFSLLGSTLPSAQAIDPKINLNNQPWSLPVVFNGATASTRWTHALDSGWQLVAQAMTQHLKTDDRIAFPFGCSAENNYDRYCSDGSFDLYDFRSEGERRRTDVLSLKTEGSLQTGTLQHQLTAGVLASRYTQRMGRQAYNWAGVGTIDGQTVVPAAPDLTDENTERTERSTELHATDRIQLGDLGLWLGLRHTALNRDAVRTDGSRATHYTQSFTTPWLAATWQLNAADMVYASWGQGVESFVTPNRDRYGAAAGQPLAAVKSRQAELGLKHEAGAVGWSATLFDIRRPQPTDTGTRYLLDGAARHRGAEAALDLREGAWSVRSSLMWLQAREEDHQIDTSLNGKTPANVAQRTARVALGYQVASLPGLALQAQLSHEGRRYVLPDNSLDIPSWTTLGASARYNARIDGRDWTLRAGVDNLLNRRAWQESPYQYGHVYLYPLAPRTFRISAQVSL